VTRGVAVDTSTWLEGVALVEGDPEGGIAPRTVAESNLAIEDSHAHHLLQTLERLLADAGWDRDAIDFYAATRGPGSFTGLRIGLGTVGGLGLASGRPCLGIGTLDAIAAAHGPDERDRMPMLDAGRREIYAARFTAGSFPPEAIEPPRVGRPDRIAAGSAGPVVAFGPGADRYRDVLAVMPGIELGEAPRSVAAAAGRIALVRLAAGGADGEGMAPLYVRPPDAILKRPRRNPGPR